MRVRRPPRSSSADRRLRTTAALERDELPPDLVARLRRGGPATSALSVAETHALRTLGGEPLGLVSGACVIRRPHQPMPSPSPRRGNPGGVRELSVRSEAYNLARTRAVERLREESELLGADAVIGVRLRRAERVDEQDVGNLVETVATGTAVRLPGRRTRGVASLTATDLAALEGRGWHALDLVAASTVCYVVSGPATVDRYGLRWSEGGVNSEYGDYTQGLYAARARAIGRIEAAAKAAGAAGVVGVTYEQEAVPVRREGFGVRDLEVTLHVLGTAIAGRAVDAPETRLAVALT